MGIAHTVEGITSFFIGVICVARRTFTFQDPRVVFNAFLLLLEDAHCVEHVQGVVNASAQVLFLSSALLGGYLGRTTNLLIP